MNTSLTLALGALSLIGSMAQAATGDAADYDINPEIHAKTSVVARSDVKADVRVARAAGELRPAGDFDAYALAPLPRTSDRSRAEVKGDVLAARRAGELIPAGEGGDLVAHATTPGAKQHGIFARLSKRAGAQ